MLEFEKKHWSSGKEFLAGIDEAGRGPLAGPVVAAAVILPHDIELPGVTDSKKISEKKRERLFGEIKSHALGWPRRRKPVLRGHLRSIGVNSHAQPSDEPFHGGRDQFCIPSIEEASGVFRRRRLFWIPSVVLGQEIRGSYPCGVNSRASRGSQ